MGAYFYVGAYFHTGAYTREALHAGEVGAYIHGVLILYGCLLSRVYGI